MGRDGPGRGELAAVGGSGGSPPPTATQIQVQQQVEAFASVSDMIQAAIVSCGATATLRQIYQGCELNGRIAYKRSGGSRLITHNGHWKAQIRHALYTGDRFARICEGSDTWRVKEEYAQKSPAKTPVWVTVDEDQSVPVPGAAVAHPRPPKPASRLTRSKHALDAFVQPSQRGKRSRVSRCASRFMEQGSNADYFPMSRSQSQDAISDSSAGRGKSYLAPRTTTGERSYGNISIFQRTAGGATAEAEGEDESQNYNLVANLTSRVRRAAITRRAEDDDGMSIMDRGVQRICSISEGIRAARGAVGAPNVLDEGRLPSYSQGASEAAGTHDRSAEAESPFTTTQRYNLRATQRMSLPGFGTHPDPVREAAERAASTTVGPIKSRFKAAAKAAEAVSLARKQEMECSGSVGVGPPAVGSGGIGMTASGSDVYASATWRENGLCATPQVQGRLRQLRPLEGMQSTHLTASGSGQGLPPATPSVSHPNPPNISYSLTTPPTLLSTLQGAASSVVQPMLLEVAAEVSSPEDGHSSDDARRVRTLRSHVAAAPGQPPRDLPQTRGFRPYQPAKNPWGMK